MYCLLPSEYLSGLLDHSIPLRDSDDYIFLKALFPRLEAWFNWFNTSQAGDYKRVNFFMLVNVVYLA